MRQFKAKLYSDKKYKLAESPFFVPETGRLSWVDIPEGKFYIEENGEVFEESFGQMIGAAVPMPPGCGPVSGDLPDDSYIDSYVIAATDGLYTYCDGVKKLLFDLKGTYESNQRSNDAKADPAGRIWFGSIVYDGGAQHGALYSYMNGEVTKRQAETKLSNGMAWNKAATKFYFSDSDEKAVFVYDYDRWSGDITNRKVLFEVTDGVPDGMCIDQNDNVWVAIWGGSRLELHDGVSGDKLAKIAVPAKQVTSCCFLEDNKLFITTASEGVDGELDGCLFTCDLWDYDVALTVELG